ncbi:hypothetical protein ACFLYB_01495 [Chloroflexota bacterium]
MKSVFLSVSLMLIMLSFAACNPSTSPTTTTKTVENSAHSINSYFSAVLFLENDAIRVNVGFYNADKGNPVFLERGDQRYTELLQYLKDCSSGKVTSKFRTTVTNGVTKTIHITILYGHNRFLDFTLSDGTTMRFTVADEVWFETFDTIYNAKYYGSTLSDFLENILPRA